MLLSTAYEVKKDFENKNRYSDDNFFSKRVRAYRINCFSLILTLQ